MQEGFAQRAQNVGHAAQFGDGEVYPPDYPYHRQERGIRLHGVRGRHVKRRRELGGIGGSQTYNSHFQRVGHHLFQRLPETGLFSQRRKLRQVGVCPLKDAFKVKGVGKPLAYDASCAYDVVFYRRQQPVDSLALFFHAALELLGHAVKYGLYRRLGVEGSLFGEFLRFGDGFPRRLRKVLPGVYPLLAELFHLFGADLGLSLHLSQRADHGLHHLIVAAQPAYSIADGSEHGDHRLGRKAVGEQLLRGFCDARQLEGGFSGEIGQLSHHRVSLFRRAEQSFKSHFRLLHIGGEFYGGDSCADKSGREVFQL